MKHNLKPLASEEEDNAELCDESRKKAATAAMSSYVNARRRYVERQEQKVDVDPVGMRFWEYGLRLSPVRGLRLGFVRGHGHKSGVNKSWDC